MPGQVLKKYLEVYPFRDYIEYMAIKITEPPDCPHCTRKMIEYNVPPVSFADGLGWGTDFLWICPNDECPIFKRGFEHTLANYGQTSSLRAIIQPDNGEAAVVPALSLDMEHFKTFVDHRNKAREHARGTAPDETVEQDPQDNIEF